MCRVHSECNTVILWNSCSKDTDMFRHPLSDTCNGAKEKKYLFYTETCTLCIRLSWLSRWRICRSPNSTLLCTRWTLPLSSKHGRSAQTGEKNPKPNIKILQVRVSVQKLDIQSKNRGWTRVRSILQQMVAKKKLSDTCKNLRKACTLKLPWWLFSINLIDWFKLMLFFGLNRYPNREVRPSYLCWSAPEHWRERSDAQWA